MGFFEQLYSALVPLVITGASVALFFVGWRLAATLRVARAADREARVYAQLRAAGISRDDAAFAVISTRDERGA
jgi:hypothetical protein